MKMNSLLQRVRRTLPLLSLVPTLACTPKQDPTPPVAPSYAVVARASGMTAAPEPTATPSGEASPSARPELNPVLPAIAPITAPPAPHVAQVEKPNATKPKRPKTQRVAENDRLFLEGRDDAAEALSRMTLLGPPEGISSVFPPRLLGTAGTGSASKTQGTGNIILGKMTSEGPLERKEIHTVLGRCPAEC